MSFALLPVVSRKRQDTKQSLSPRRKWILFCYTNQPARKQAQDIYLPVILGLNLVYYVLLKYMRASWLQSTAWEIGFGILFAVAYYLLYQQILDHAMTARRDDKRLIGGHWLDVLAVLAVIQFGTAFSTTFYWLLLVLPVWAAWSLYQTVMGKGGIMGGSGSTSTSSATASGAEGADPTNRKQRRAEQRSQRK